MRITIRTRTLGTGLAALAAALALPHGARSAPDDPGPHLKAPGPARAFPEYEPFFGQLGGRRAVVPMVHGPAGLQLPQTRTHRLATSHGSLDVPARVSMRCPENRPLTYLAYKVGAQPWIVLADHRPNGKGNGRTAFLKIRPFTAAELGEACRQALGGNWPAGESHRNPAPVVERWLTKKVVVEGGCYGWTKLAFHKVRIRLRCVDRSWK